LMVELVEVDPDGVSVRSGIVAVALPEVLRVAPPDARPGMAGIRERGAQLTATLVEATSVRPVRVDRMTRAIPDEVFVVRISDARPADVVVVVDGMQPDVEPARGDARARRLGDHLVAVAVINEVLRRAAPVVPTGMGPHLAHGAIPRSPDVEHEVDRIEAIAARPGAPVVRVQAGIEVSRSGRRE